MKQVRTKTSFYLYVCLARYTSTEDIVKHLIRCESPYDTQEEAEEAAVEDARARSKGKLPPLKYWTRHETSVMGSLIPIEDHPF